MNACIQVRARGAHVSRPAVLFWLDLLQRACEDAAAAAVTDAAAELAAMAAQPQQSQQQKPMVAQVEYIAYLCWVSYEFTQIEKKKFCNRFFCPCFCFFPLEKSLSSQAGVNDDVRAPDF